MYKWIGIIRVTSEYFHYCFLFGGQSVATLWASYQSPDYLSSLKLSISVLFVVLLLPLLWTSGDIYPEFQRQGDSSHLHATDGFLRIPSGAAPANRLVVSMSAELLCSTYYFKHWLGSILRYTGGGLFLSYQ